VAPGLRTRPRGRTFFELRNYSQKMNDPTLKTDLESAWNSGLSCVSVTFISWSPSLSRVSWSSTVAPFHFLGPYFFLWPNASSQNGRWGTWGEKVVKTTSTKMKKRFRGHIEGSKKKYEWSGLTQVLESYLGEVIWESYCRSSLRSFYWTNYRYTTKEGQWMSITWRLSLDTRS
jgi:hypothetical protein